MDKDFEVKITHSGQKRAYGDTFREFEITSDKPEEEVKNYCLTDVYKCDLTNEQHLLEVRRGVKDFGDHFRASYKFKKIGDNTYFYQVIEPSTH